MGGEHSGLKQVYTFQETVGYLKSTREFTALIMQSKCVEGGECVTESGVLSTTSDDPRPSLPWSLPLVTAVNSLFSIKVQRASAFFSQEGQELPHSVLRIHLQGHLNQH